MRRMLVLLTVVAMMGVMLAMSVAPAFASRAVFQCTNPKTGGTATTNGSGKHVAKQLGFTECRKL